MKESHDFGVLLALSYATFVAALRAQLAQDGYTDLHGSFGYVARALAERPLTLRELADQLALTSQGALKIVDEMQASGYVERRPDPQDARAKRLFLTRRGKRALAAARAFHGRFEAELARRIGAKQVESARAALTQIVSEAERSGKAPALRPV
jgi:DNA-binding MarR family transcriptional regulator